MLHTGRWQKLLLRREPLSEPAACHRLHTFSSYSPARNGSVYHRALAGIARRAQQRVRRSAMEAAHSSMAPAMAQSLRRDLWQRLVHVYDAALASGALLTTESTDQSMPDGGIDFLVRVAASLREKAKSKQSKTGHEKQEWQDPFDPHEEALFVHNLGPGHKLLLNKFNVVAHHCLVVTNDFQHQTERMNAGDLWAAWQVLQAMPHGGVCYYNCGVASGASQRHKHIQIVPLPFAAGRPSMPVADVLRQALGSRASSTQTAAVVEIRQLPYQSFGHSIPSQEHVSADELQNASNAVFEAMGASTIGEGVHSYNVLLTHDYIIYVPRSRESSGPAGVNALGFAGTLFVRSEEELQYLRQHGILRVLKNVGLPWRD